MSNTDTINCKLSREQAAMLSLMTGQWDNVGFLFSEGVFDTRGGNVILSFDINGVIGTIKKEVFSRRGVDKRS